MVGTCYSLLRAIYQVGLPYGSMCKQSTCNAGNTGYVGSISGLGKMPCRRKGQPTPVFLPENGQRNLAGYSPKGCKELDMAYAHCHAH